MAVGQSSLIDGRGSKLGGVEIFSWQGTLETDKANYQPSGGRAASGHPGAAVAIGRVGRERCRRAHQRGSPVQAKLSSRSARQRFSADGSAWRHEGGVAFDASRRRVLTK